jgi:transglutaminase-like putative cysteine protease
MTKYYIKNGYEEIGPLSIEELRKHKINKTTFVREEDSDLWVEAESLLESKKVYRRDFRWLKFTGFTLLIGAVIFGVVVISNTNRNSPLPDDLYYEDEEMEEILPPPPKIEFSVTRHEKKFFKELFKDCNMSGDKKQLVEACNFKNKDLRNKAVSIAGQNAGDFNLGQICDVFDYCNNNWKYVNDPARNEIYEYASNTLFNGLNGDCDDFAILVCSMLLSIGGEARINFVYGENSGHAFTEVNIGQTPNVEDYITKRYKKVYDNSGIWTRTDKQGNKWLNLDWFAKFPGGKYYDYSHGTTFYILQGFCNDFRKN